MRLVRNLAPAVGAALLMLLPAPAHAGGRADVHGSDAAARDVTRVVSHSVTQPGTAWWTDAVTGTPVVAADDTVDAASLSRLTDLAGRTGARLVRETGRFERRIAGGDPFSATPGSRCNIGFNARRASTYYFLTSAHCVGAVGSTVYTTGGVVLGVVQGRNARYDYAIVRYTNAAISKPSAVNLYSGGALQAITTAASGYVNQSVRRSGSVTGIRSGRITALNVTVNYADGTVYGLIRTTVCAEPGDSGGPLFSGTSGLGMLSGGSGNCTTGGTSYYAAVTRALSEYGVAFY